MIDSTSARLPADHLAIQELRHRYGRALDTRDWDLFRSLFAEEVEADFSAFGIPAGRVSREHVLGWMQHAFRREGMKTSQIYANFEITIDGDRATCVSSLLGRHRLPGLDGGEDFTLHARYHDRLVRTETGWKLAGVAIEVLFTEGNLAMVS